MFKYPWNKYGFTDKIEMPIRHFFNRLKVFKGIPMFLFECCDIQEWVFAHFKAYLKYYPFNAIEQYAMQGNALGKIPWVSEERLEKYLKVYHLQDYVHTREVNQAKMDYLWELLGETKERDHALYIDWWFERDELMFKTKITEEDYLQGSNLFDIENAMDKLDIQRAKEIIELKSYIWD